MSDTNDIPQRLRDLRRGDYSRDLFDTAAAEITRLRAELAQRTAEVAQRTADLDQMTVHRNAAIEHRDITQQVLNGITVALSQRTADLAKANAERDEARRAACKSESRYFDRVQWPPPYKPCEDRILCRAKEIAAERGWDCFKKEVKP